ncbi:hypothetical protein GALMADRAFT_144686 [Galerina marginata CBS 339.88]|uniref:Uncharacterized protein n=1 Tax=Galerina marginata (strain CBS 339.88) TaxID=685588 RepID=A0A067SUD6_GALM3|nr:hypothetical protein GALMADRAFT_144686 [Galerina marginata CBS 339.88]
MHQRPVSQRARRSETIFGLRNAMTWLVGGSNAAAAAAARGVDLRLVSVFNASQRMVWVRVPRFWSSSVLTGRFGYVYLPKFVRARELWIAIETST